MAICTADIETTVNKGCGGWADNLSIEWSTNQEHESVSLRLSGDGAGLFDDILLSKKQIILLGKLLEQQE